jgi:hypothetical protein
VVLLRVIIAQSIRGIDSRVYFPRNEKLALRDVSISGAMI